jgi:protein gp37
MRQHNPNAKIRARYAGLLNAQGKFNGKVRFIEGDLDKPLRVRKPTVWSVWNDLFHEGVSDDNIARTLAVCLSPRTRRVGHHFLILTKRPDRASKLLCSSAFAYMVAERSAVVAYSHPHGDCVLARWQKTGELLPPNVGLGTTVGHPDSLWRVEELLKVPAVFRFLSIEPLLEELDLDGYLAGNYSCVDCKYVGNVTGPHLFCQRCGDEMCAEVCRCGEDAYDTSCPRCGAIEEFGEYGCEGKYPTPPVIDWLIIGCESGPHRRPCKPEWVKSLVDQADAAGVPVFVKQLEINGKVAANMAEFPEWARRREFPGGDDGN